MDYIAPGRSAYESTISYFPAELLLEIFTQYLPLYPHCAPQSGDGSPTQLMLVCREWHDLVLSDPHFWRTLLIRKS